MTVATIEETKTETAVVSLTQAAADKLLAIMNEKGLSTLKICEQKLVYLNYSLKTIKIYLWYINQFLKIIKENQIRPQPVSSASPS